MHMPDLAYTWHILGEGHMSDRRGWGPNGICCTVMKFNSVGDLANILYINDSVVLQIMIGYMGRSKGSIDSVATLRGKSCFHHSDREDGGACAISGCLYLEY